MGLMGLMGSDPLTLDSYEPFPFITEVKITDENDNDLGPDVNKSATVKIGFAWSIPNKVNVPADTAYGMQLPTQISILRDMAFPLNDEDGYTVANLLIETDGTVTITFTQYAEEHSNVSGWFYIETQFKKEEIGNANPVEIIFEVDGTSEPYKIEVNFKQPDPTVSKSGTYEASTNTITWEVTVNPEEVTLKDAEFTDNILAGQEYVTGSFSINPVPDPEGTIAYTPADPGDTVKTGVLTYTFPDVIKDKYIITFKTVVTAFEGQEIPQYNKALVTHDNGTLTYSNNAKVTVKADLIKKEGSYDKNNKKISWKITVNGEKLPLNNVKVKDYLPITPAKLVLMPETVKLKNVDTGEETALSAEDYNFDSGSNIFEYEFSGPISHTYEITFSTAVPDSYYYNYIGNPDKTFTNQADLTIDNYPGITIKAEKGLRVTNSVIDKTGGGYNPSTRKITWNITVNSNKVNIQNAQVTDTINTGQEFIAGSVTQTVGTYSYDSVTKTLTFDLGDISTQQTITFETLVTNPDFTAVNGSEDYYNTATLTGNNIDDSTSQGSQTVTSEVIKKTGGDGTYDYTTRELTWTIVVNQNKMPLENAVVTDTVSPGQEFVDDSVTQTAGTYSYDSGTKTLIFNLGDITAQETITFKTKITDLSIFETNGDKELKNTAYLTNNFGPEVKNTGKTTITNTLVGKTGKQPEAGDEFIDWVVVFNQNLLPFTEAQLTDVLQEGLSLDTSTVKLFKLTLNPDGLLTKGSEVILGDDEGNISYDGATRKFVFTMPDPAAGEYLGAYQLEFRTDVEDKGQSPFTNTISFEGRETQEGSNSADVAIISQEGGGWAVGETGSITVTKVDADNTSKKLSGAVFALLDQYKNILRQSLPTAADGEALFDKLKFGVTYYIQELTAPTDYVKSDELYKFKLNSTDEETGITYGKDITYEFVNHEVTGSITIIKVDSVNTDRQLPRAVFELLDADQEFIKTITSDTNGVAVCDGLKINTTYFIKEKTPPSGYRLSEELYGFQVKNTVGELDIEYKFENVKIPDSPKKRGSIQIVKIDAENPDLKLSGAVFELLDANKNVITESSPTIYNGIVVFNQLSLNTTYFIREKKAPEGYQLSTGLYEFRVPNSGGQRDITYEFKNTKLVEEPEKPIDPEKPLEPQNPEEEEPGAYPGDGGTGGGQPGDESIYLDDEGAGTPKLPNTGGGSTLPLYMAGLGLVVLGLVLRRITV